LGIALAAAAGVGLGLLGFTLYSAMRGPVGGGAEVSPAARPVSSARPRLSGWHGRGLDITEVVDGRPAYSLKVERVRHEPGPLGFFHVGFLQVPVLEDARLTVQSPAGSAGGSNPVEAVEAALASLVARHDLVNLGWIGGFPGIKASPLRLQVLRDGRAVLVLESATATVDVRQRQLDLEGQVRLAVEGGARVLESDRLHFSLKTQQIWTDREVRLQTPAGRSQAPRFSGDVLLGTVGVRPVRLGERETRQAQAAEVMGEEGRP
jgi:hypothetical protein